MLSVPFALYEYDTAFTRFFEEAVRTLAQARSPILREIQFIEAPGTVGSRVRDRQGMDVDLEPSATSTDFTADLNAVRLGDYQRLYAELDQASDSMAEQPAVGRVRRSRLGRGSAAQDDRLDLRPS